MDYLLEPANFSDYRDFFKFRFDGLKEKFTSISLQSIANKSGLSKSHVQFLFKKERHITLDKFPRLAKALKLTEEEEYFTYLLICKNSSQNEYVKSHFESIMKRIRHQYVKVHPEAGLVEKNLETINKSSYNKLLNMVLKSLIRLKEFKEDGHWIIENIAIDDISSIEVNNALKELEKSSQIQRDQNGKLISNDHDLFRPDPYDPSGFDIYTKAAEFVLKLMQKPELYSPAVYSSMSLAMSEENLLKAEKLMIETHHKLCQLSKDSLDPTSVIFVGNFLMTLSRLKKTKTLS